MPFWMISAICAVVAMAASFVYVQYFLPWPNGAPPKIAGKWKLASRTTSEQNGKRDILEEASHTSQTFEMVQNGESFHLLLPKELKIAPFSGTLKPPDQLKFTISSPETYKPPSYAIVEGRVDTSGGQMTIRGIWKSYHNGEQKEFETGVWAARRVDEQAESSPENAVITD